MLREWRSTDLDPFVALNADPIVMKYFPSVLTRKEVEEIMDRIIAHFLQWDYGLFATELKSDGSFIGFIGLSHPRFESHFTPCVEVGWRLRKEVWGKGLATEGAAATLNYAFQTLNEYEIYSFTAVKNIASYRVMEKIGMTRIGTFMHPNLPQDHQLSEHWIYRAVNKNDN